MNPEAFETAGRRLSGVLIRWMLTAVSVWVATLLVRGVDYADGPSLLAAALILGILNALVKPLLIAVALPLVLLSLGFVLLFINAFLLIITAILVPGFHVAGFWSAMGASLIISLVSMILGNYKRRSLGSHPHRRNGAESRNPEPIRTPPPGKGPIIDV